MKQLFLILCHIIAVVGYCQVDSTDWNLRISGCTLSNGYIFQKEHIYEVGVKIDYINDNSKYRISENLSLILGGQVTRHNSSTYLNPFGSLRYLRPFSDRFGGIVSISYSYRKELGLVSNTITPEIGVNINQVTTISYGYNFFLDNKFAWVSKSRLAIRFMLH